MPEGCERTPWALCRSGRVSPVTDLEAAYNCGVADATDALRVAARAILEDFGLDQDGLLGLAELIDGLKIGSPTEDVEVER